MWPSDPRRESSGVHPDHCTCGAHLVDSDLHVRLGLPDRVLALPEGEKTPGVGIDNTDPWRAVFLEEPTLGCFVRSTLRLPLTEDSSLTYGLWVRVSMADAQRIGRVWRTEEYAELRFDGWLANKLDPFDHLDAPVHVEVEAANELPHVVSSDSVPLQALLNTASERNAVLDAVAASGAMAARDGEAGLDAVLTTRPVAEGRERAMLILHQHDGTWQIIGSTDGTEENAVMIHFSHLVNQDSTLAEARDLPQGGLMERQWVGWSRLHFNSDDEMDAYLDA